MKVLLILRHAKSSWKEPYRSDHDRDLNRRGKEDAPLMGKLIDREDLIPDLIITSSAVRAHKTAKAVARSSGFNGKILETGALYGAGTGTFLEILRELSDDYKRVMVVGHNPGMEELLEDLTGSYERLATATLAYVSLPVDSWADLTLGVEGKLVSCWRPKELDAY
jgi:phosphohistidine phosphatase